MLLVKTKIKESDIHGIGLFADQFIPEGTKIWKFTKGFDQRFTKEQVLNFPDLAQIFLYKYSSLSRKSGLYLLCADYGNFFNHSDTSNALTVDEEGEEEPVVVAIRDIQPDEEITDNYSSFEELGDKDNVLDEIAIKFNLGDELDPRIKNKKMVVL